MKNAPDKAALRAQILDLVREYHGAAWPATEFDPAATPVQVSGRVFDAEEVVHLVDSSLDFWLTTGRFAAEFERAFSRYLGRRSTTLCNSGSSANLLALSCLTSPKLGDRRLVPGDEVLTVAAGFPTTVAPILINNLVPVYVDVELGTYNADVGQLAAAVGPRTRAIMLAHTLGNPFDLDAVCALAKKHDLWLIEDNCDALGSTYDGRLTATFGDLATSSFYPAHHITMGEGGAVVTDSPQLRVLLESFRDWGRDCWCDPGIENTCGKRFDWQLGGLPHGYDHKYSYSHVGYNLKLTDMQAAVGVAQMGKLPGFIAARKRNWERLAAGLSRFEEHFLMPRATPKSDPSWFGFLLSVRPGAPFTRNDIVRHLESKRIATRLMFAGNLVRQPAFSGQPHRVVGPLTNSDYVMNQSFWVGVYPGLSESALEYVITTVAEFVAGR